MLRRRLHAVAEIADNEAETAAILAEHLEAEGFRVTKNIGGHGLLATASDAPRIIARAELDALPLEEQTGASYAAAKNHHACGHDGHMAMLAEALILSPKAPVAAFFQPAEETGHGMLRALESLPSVEAAYAFHNIPGAPLGQVQIRDGIAALASTGIKFSFDGQTSHASEPGKARSSAAAIAALVVAAQQPPAGQIAICGFEHGGEHYGTAGASGEFWATLRGSDEAIEDAVSRLTSSARDALADGVSMAIERIEPFPATVNDAACAENVRTAARAAGLDSIQPDPYPWSEDFGHLLQRVPGALIGLGSGIDQPPLHAPQYDFPDALLSPGIALWHAIWKHHEVSS